MIKYIRLYNYLTQDEKLSSRAALRNILRIRKLPVEYRKAIVDIMDGLIPYVSCNNITLDELINKDGMSPVRALLFLDWVRKEPANAIKYMAKDTLRDIHPMLSDTENEALNKDIERLRLLVEKSKREKIEAELNSKTLTDDSDINLD